MTSRETAQATQATLARYRWRFTGSSVSGIGYGYGIYMTDDQTPDTPYAVRIGFGGTHAILIPCATWQDAELQGERFCHVWHCWRAVQERARLHALGYATIG
jgi:hypothetical protein